MTIENSCEIEILKDEVEMKVSVTTTMLLLEAKRRGRLRFRAGGTIYTITAQEEES